MKTRSIKAQLFGALVITDLVMAVLILMAVLAMGQIRNEIIQYADGTSGVPVEALDQTITQFLNAEIALAIIGAILVSIFLYMIRHSLIRKIQGLEGTIEELAKGNMTIRVDDSMGKQDEFGRLHHSLEEMTSRLEETIGDVKNRSTHITGKVQDMTSSIGCLSENIENVAASAQELSASMGEMYESASRIMETMNQLDGAAKSVANRSVEGAETVEEIKERALQTKANMMIMQQKLAIMHEEISKGVSDSIEKIHVVEKIGALSESIMDITDQTTLLSLNASIEAARAGESGRGFAVVANEIQKLAVQSKQSAEDIQAIISLVMDAVKALSGNSQKLLDFVSEDVRTSFEKFMEMAEAYNIDAENVDGMVTDFSAISQELAASIESVNTEIQRIDNSIGECAKASEEIAQMNTQIGEMSHNTREAVEDTSKITDILRNAVEGYKVS